MKRKALITGIAGQDGSYLAELLLEKDYEVFGLIPRRSTPQTQTLRIDHIARDLNLEYGDVMDLASIYRILKLVQPDEIYHLAAQSHVQISFTEPIHTSTVISVGTLNMLEATSEFSPKARFYNAASSEIFGNTPDFPIDENSRMIPCSPYAAAKLQAYHLTRIFRVSKNIFASNGILFNHESPRRGLNFVTAKVVKGAADFVRAMWMILQHSAPDEFVVATGRQVTIRELCACVFDRVGLGDYSPYVVTSAQYVRPYELKHLRGDPAKIKRELGWEPRYTFEELIEEMIVDIEKEFYGSTARESNTIDTTKSMTSAG
jgi:GDPmannose 4,6-dehydratase